MTDSVCPLKYLVKHCYAYHLKIILIEYPLITEHILSVVLMYLDDKVTLRNDCFWKFVTSTVNHASNLRVCLRSTCNPNKWQARYMYRIAVQRTIEELMDMEVCPYRILCYGKVRHMIMDPKYRFITFDKGVIVMEDQRIDFAAFDPDFDFLFMVYFYAD